MRSIKEKKERALGTKLFIKAERCNSHKCATIRKPYRPGQHGNKRRQKSSEFAEQLQEKQKIQIVYGLTNKQMRKLFLRYSDSPEKIVSILEKRLDRVVFLLGFAASTRIARQMVAHGHILVNDRIINFPSYQVKENDVISIKPKSRSSKLFEELEVRLKKHETPAWLKLDKKAEKGVCISEPPLEAILPFNVNLVGEYYTR